ncbi:hypothetical protein T492DRAFT_879346 [Pavlovales sp. CCMP2436]|nr:hypothetical protein T492DRAFT_879346 [Pavlovales sp. CCMP2436]
MAPRHSTCGAYELLYFDASKKGRGKQDVSWASQSCVFGWPVMGIWPEGCDGTDINAVALSHKSYKLPGDKEAWRRHLVSADDFGTVRLFHYPCVKRRAKYRE